MASGDKDWFKVDKKGLAQTLERRGKWFAIAELWQNAVDTGAKNVTMTLTANTANPRLSQLAVEDDDPDGFKDLTHAYTLFAPSEKKADPTKRGRFNIGEKLVLAMCDEATITSTKGGVRFDDEGRHDVRLRRNRGSKFEATIRMNRQEREECADKIRTLIVPDGVEATYNGMALEHRKARMEFQTSLPTEFANEDGDMRRSRRLTPVRLYDVQPGEEPTIYELGIPVVEFECAFHADVQQKVPLNFERDNVTTAFLRELQTNVLSNSHTLLSDEEAAKTWVTEGLPNATDDAVRDIVTKRYGDMAVAYDPSSPESSKLAVAMGYTVVPGGAFPKASWERIREVGVLQPAGHVTPAPAVLIAQGDSNGKTIPEGEWTEAQQTCVDYAKRMFDVLIGGALNVELRYSLSQNFHAWYGPRHLTINTRIVHRDWFERALEDTADLDALLIHEFAHDRVSDHLSSEFAGECCRLGAKLHRKDVPIGQQAAAVV